MVLFAQVYFSKMQQSDMSRRKEVIIKIEIDTCNEVTAERTIELIKAIKDQTVEMIDKAKEPQKEQSDEKEKAD